MITMIASVDKNRGITRYWSETPIRIIFGDLSTSLKFAHVKVIPMQNITTVSNGMIADLNPENTSGKKKATEDKIMAHKGKSLVSHKIIDLSFEGKGQGKDLLKISDPAD